MDENYERLDSNTWFNEWVALWELVSGSRGEGEWLFESLVNIYKGEWQLPIQKKLAKQNYIGSEKSYTVKKSHSRNRRREYYIA